MKKKLYDQNYFVAGSPKDSLSYNFMSNNYSFDPQNKCEIVQHPIVNFVINDYLALSIDNRIKQASSWPAAEEKDLYQSAEESLSRIFDKPVVLFPNSNTVHTLVLPHIIDPKDIMFYDRYVHSNLRIAIGMFKHEISQVRALHHNNINILEEKLKDPKTRG
ncbi:MAG TPA: hypothetical protein VIH57_02650, partial [Bacteroidales bacterium]